MSLCGYRNLSIPFHIFCWLHGHRESLSLPLNSKFATLRAVRRWINSLKLSFFYSMGSETTDHFPFHPFFLFRGHRELLSIPLRSIFSTPRAVRPLLFVKTEYIWVTQNLKKVYKASYLSLNWPKMKISANLIFRKAPKSGISEWIFNLYYPLSVIFFLISSLGFQQLNL